MVKHQRLVDRRQQLAVFQRRIAHNSRSHDKQMLSRRLNGGKSAGSSSASVPCKLANWAKHLNHAHHLKIPRLPPLFASRRTG
ncbi:hypothetical protein KCP78_02650 [Salmonella enterica subsp. enterica]|nr:hypothetical protein KCP78_02650 [Salmonella enterica subsp. enterica]